MSDDALLDAFNEYVDGLRVALTREARPPTEDERRTVFLLWDAVERELEDKGFVAYTVRGINRWTNRLPTSRRTLEAEFGTPELVQDNPDPETLVVARGRPSGSAQSIPFDTFRAVVEMALDGTSAREITVATSARGNGWAFVNRDKATAIIAWVRRDRAAARRVVGGGKIPLNFSATFSATRDGVIVPTRESQ